MMYKGKTHIRYINILIHTAAPAAKLQQQPSSRATAKLN